MALRLSHTVLVVDDSPITVKVVRRLLARIGFRKIDDAANGLDAIEKMSQKKYDLLLADWNMEPMSGYELLKQVRADAGLAKTLVILMTNGPTVEQVVAAKNSGGYFIAKPFTAERLMAKIDAASLASDLQTRPLHQ